MSGKWSIPAGWHWNVMGDVADIVGGGTPRSDQAEYFGGDIPWITPADLSGYSEKFISIGARSITKQGLDNSGAKLMPAGAVLFSSRAPIGYVAIAANPVSTNQGFKSFVLRDGLMADFVYYYLQHAKKLAVELASGTTFLEISGKKAAQIPIPVPPLPEQRRIVAEIEKQFTRLETGINALKRVQSNLKRYRAAVLKAACEGKLVPTEAALRARSQRSEIRGQKYETGEALLKRILAERREKWLALHSPERSRRGDGGAGKGKYKEPAAPDTANLPKLPEGWTWANFPQLDDGSRNALKAGPFGSSLKKSVYVEKGYKIYGQEQVIRGDPYYGDYYINRALFEKLRTCEVRPGDILISLVGTTGRVLIIPDDMEPGIINPRLVKLSLSRTGVDPKYVRLFLESSQARSFFKFAAHGGTMEIITLGILKEIPVPLPPLAEQKRIVAEVERRLSVVEELETLVSANLQRATRLRQSVLQKAFSGGVGMSKPWG